jgi:hypothetical protein
VSGSQHPHRDRAQAIAVGLEALGEPVGLGHGHLLLIPVVISLTDHTGSM